MLSIIKNKRYKYVFDTLSYAVKYPSGKPTDLYEEYKMIPADTAIINPVTADILFGLCTDVFLLMLVTHTITSLPSGWLFRLCFLFYYFPFCIQKFYFRVVVIIYIYFNSRVPVFVLYKKADIFVETFPDKQPVCH